MNIRRRDGGGSFDRSHVAEFQDAQRHGCCRNRFAEGVFALFLPDSLPKQDLLRVSNLTVQYRSERGAAVTALRGVNLTIQTGDIIGVLGESGSGKSTLALSLCRLLPSSAAVQSGSLWFGNVDLLTVSEREMQTVRGSQICLLGQDPISALNPVLRVGEQVKQVVRAHSDDSAASCRAKARQMLERVGLAEARYYDAYPHQLSGGQQQRVAIAQALACSPRLLIADEPTSSLDVVTQNAILELLRRLICEMEATLLFISHDPDLVGRMTSRTVIMYAGCVVESGRTAEVYAAPRHPYTASLLQSRPRLGQTGKRDLPCVPGDPPSLLQLIAGCAFEPRCGRRIAQCSLADPPEVTDWDAARTARCFNQII